MQNLGEGDRRPDRKRFKTRLLEQYNGKRDLNFFLGGGGGAEVIIEKFGIVVYVIE